MIEKLRQWYNKTGISADHFSCPYEDNCRSVCSNFVTAREAFIGSKYESGELGRLLFISLDASSDHPGPKPENRTLHALRRSEEAIDGCNPNKLDKRKHWYWTHKLTFDILTPVANKAQEKNFSWSHVHQYFAHTNSAKCKDQARGTRQGQKLLFKNCQEFIAPEVELLYPDVIITQGVNARLSIEGKFKLFDTIKHPISSPYKVKILIIKGRKVLMIPTYHQSSWGYFHTERKKAYPWYIKTATDFILKKNSESEV